MARYKQLTKSKREFLEEVISYDEEYNFLMAPVYSQFLSILQEKRYLTEESEWINKQINEVKPTILKLRKGEY